MRADRLRVLWFTNVPLPSCADAAGLASPPTGSWLGALADALVASKEVELSVATAHPNTAGCAFDVGGIRHYVVPSSSFADVQKPIGRALQTAYAQVIRQAQPDLIHVHGLGHHYGLIDFARCAGSPVVVSIQASPDDVQRQYFGGLGLRDVLRLQTPWAVMRGTSLLQEWLRWRAWTPHAIGVIRRCRHFIGRTRYDRALVQSLNPDAHYHHGDELLRGSFYGLTGDRSRVRPHSVFAPAGFVPFKGAHVLLRAVAVVRRSFPDVLLRVASMPVAYRRPAPGYARYLGRLIGELDLRTHVEPLGRLTAEEMANELERAHVFALPSFVENSPNSLCEAMMAGTPAVVSYVGGVPSLVGDGTEALCTPVGDHRMLAERITRLFRDPKLADRLSAAARLSALSRHDPTRVVAQTVGTYREVVGI